MRIRYLGTAAAEGFPAVFCNCAACIRARELGELRTRSQALIDETLLVDLPPETYYHAVRFGIDLSALSHLLVTHSHTDHFYAQELVNRGYKFAYGMRAKTLRIYGDETVREVFAEGTAREIKDDVRADICFITAEPFTAFDCGGYEVYALPAKHTPSERALVYFIRKDGKGILYLNDTGLPDEGLYDFLREHKLRADLVSFDCTLGGSQEIHSGRHMNVYENAQVLEKLLRIGAAAPDVRAVITHFSHNAAPFRKDMDSLAAKFGFIAAYDGMTIEI